MTFLRFEEYETQFRMCIETCRGCKKRLEPLGRIRVSNLYPNRVRLISSSRQVGNDLCLKRYKRMSESSHITLLTWHLKINKKEEKAENKMGYLQIAPFIFLVFNFHPPRGLVMNFGGDLCIYGYTYPSHGGFKVHKRA